MNNTNHPNRSLNQCADKNLNSIENLDKSPPYCDNNKVDYNNQRDVNGDDLGFLFEDSKKTGYGAKVDCDPVQRGYIVNDVNNPDRNYIFRYSKSIRGTDEALLDMFKTIVVIDENGKAHPIPVIPGTPEKAIAAIIQDNVRKDNTNVVDRLKLPLMALTQSNIDVDLNRFTFHKAVDFFRINGKPSLTLNEKFEKDTVLGVSRGIPINISYSLTVWTTYQEDMNQILEQIITKFSQAAYIRVKGIYQEIIVTLDSIANISDLEPGDENITVRKFEFNLTAQSYIPQAIERKKSVLSMKVDIVDGLSEQEISQVMTQIEESVKECS